MVEGGSLGWPIAAGAFPFSTSRSIPHSTIRSISLSSARAVSLSSVWTAPKATAARLGRTSPTVTISRAAFRVFCAKVVILKAMAASMRVTLSNLSRKRRVATVSVSLALGIGLLTKEAFGITTFHSSIPTCTAALVDACAAIVGLLAGSAFVSSTLRRLDDLATLLVSAARATNSQTHFRRA
jgi:hypothetical protein